MGTGALLPMDIRPPAFRKAELSPDPLLNGPDLVFVRFRPGVSATVGRAGLQRIVQATDKALNADPAAAGNNITLVAVQRPAQIVNYRSIGAAPELLAVGLALGAVFALGLTLTASVRRRRRELALLKTLGFSRRQLAATVAAQATVIAVIGIVIGIPAGIVTGRWLWTLFARAISAVPQPTVPTMAIVAVGTRQLWCSRTSLPRSPDASRRAHRPPCCSKPSSPPYIRFCADGRRVRSSHFLERGNSLGIEAFDDEPDAERELEDRDRKRGQSCNGCHVGR